MKFALIAIALLCLSTSAFADYFGCTLKVSGYDWVDVEAEYRGREVTNIVGPFKCTAQIDQNLLVKATLLSINNGDEASATDRAKVEVGLWTLNTQGDGMEYASCECGLR